MTWLVVQNSRKLVVVLLLVVVANNNSRLTTQLDGTDDSELKLYLR